MRIQDVCKETGIARRNIHFYIKEGLISPQVEATSHYYEFGKKELMRLRLIREYRHAGLSLPVIRSLLNKPHTAGYYLNVHIRELNRQKQQLEKTIHSLDHILDHLPGHPGFDSLYQLSMDADIPDPDLRQYTTAEFDRYDTLLVNNFLWGNFLPAEPFTDYQEFLWEKLNRLTRERSTKSYRRLCRFLKNLDQQTIDHFLRSAGDYYSVVASLSREELLFAADQQLATLHAVVDSPAMIRHWKQYYEDFYCPNTSIFASEFSDLAAELSPLFRDFRKNIDAICSLTYQKLHSEENEALLLRLMTALEGYVDLDRDHHGQLAALSALTEIF